MFPSGSFAVTLQCSHQCDHSVPGSENLKRTQAMYQRCSKSVHLQCPGSVPALYRFWEILGTLQAHDRETGKTGRFEMCLQFSQNFPKFSQSGTLQEHSQDTANVLIWNIFGTSLWFFQNFQAWYTVLQLTAK